MTSGQPFGVRRSAFGVTSGQPFGVRCSAFGVGISVVRVVSACARQIEILLWVLDVRRKQRRTPNAERRTFCACAWFLCILPLALHAGDSAAYTAWASGHPADAVPALEEAARVSGRWDAWYDAGLAAAAAGDRARAAADLLTAHRLAPERDEPRAALRSNGTPLPATWCDDLGPVTWPGTGVVGIIVLTLAGVALGWAAVGRRGRAPAAVAGSVLLLIAAPGVIAVRHDAQRDWVAVVRDTQLLDSTGAPQQPLAAGTIVDRDPAPAWSGRVLVTLTDGKRGFVAESDVR